MYKLGFIGTGNMGSALLRASLVNTSADEILISNKPMDRAEQLAAQLGCTAGDNCQVAGECEYIFLGVKPQMMAQLMEEIAPVLRAREDRYILVSMAAGMTISSISEMVGAPCPVIRIMPNVAASVGEAMTLLAANELVNDGEISEFCDKMAGAGRFDKIAEGLIDAGSAVSGCGPAYVYMFIEAMADGAVACGLPRDKALEYAAQTLLGASKLMLESGRHPGELKDSVCSPGGTTIAGVGALEAAGFRGAAMEAVKAAYRRTLEIGK